MANYRETADVLHQEATQLLKDHSLWHLFNQNGKLHAAGSYALDLLVWRDLDLYFEPAAGKNGLSVLADVTRELVLSPNVRRLKLEKSFNTINPFLPKGIYLGLKIITTEDITWKVDIWVVEKEYQTQKLQETADLKAAIDLRPELKELILSLKHQLKGNAHRTPSLSSYYVYQGVLEHDIKLIDEMKLFLKEKGLPAFQ